MLTKCIYYAISFMGCFSFWFAIIYAIGFLQNLIIVPKSIDSGTAPPFGWAFTVNMMLLFIFGLQHSIMARRWFKQWWVQFIPEPLERSIYVISANAIFMMVLLCWQPMPGVIWDVQNTIVKILVYGIFTIGCAGLIHSLIIIGHFDMIGIRQVHLFIKGKPYTPLEFVTPALYKYVRHPIMLTTLIAFWATPTMTVGHLLFAMGMTMYVIIGLRYEEKDLINLYGETYREYKENVRLL